MTPDKSFGRNMEKLRKCSADVETSNVIYSGEGWPLGNDGRFINFGEIAKTLD